MGGLAHYIEDEGVPTTGISLVRENTEQLSPPRFLWVPFELGRPFGAPDAPVFQTRVLRAALALLERQDGPPILEDFPNEAPGGGARQMTEYMTGWTCPIPLPPKDTSDDADQLANILAEIASLAPWQTLARETRGRTGLGAARMEIEQSVRFLHALLQTDGQVENPTDELSLGQCFRGAAEDLKTFYMEAATAQPGRATSTAVANWFWGGTEAGQLLLALYPVCLTAADAGVRHVALAQLVPRAQMHRL